MVIFCENKNELYSFNMRVACFGSEIIPQQLRENKTD